MAASEQGPVLATEGQSAAEIGDETLLLLAHAPTVVSADRAAGAKLIEGTDASVIVMDDGLSKPAAREGFQPDRGGCQVGLGNGLVMPAGRCGRRSTAQMPRADALMLIGDGGKAAP